MLKLAQTSCYQHSGCPLLLLSQAGWEPWDAVWWQMTAAWSVELQSAHKCLTFGKVYLPTLVPLSGSRCWASDSPFVALCGWDWVCFELSEVPFGLVAELIILCEFCWAQTAPGMCHRYLEIDWHSSSSRQMPAALCSCGWAWNWWRAGQPWGPQPSRVWPNHCFIAIPDIRRSAERKQ